jgi:LmbE family N-acetylglucosaminyl deacetylase
MRAWLAVLVAICSCALLVKAPLDAQVRPVYDRGTAGLVQTLLQLRTTASALHTGAHPDDEDSAFIARTARGDHARVAYLSLNRGEGGQNLIGPELFDALGVIRTEELLQARRLDGGEQFFTRAFDFGFSKSRSETATRWNEQELLEDMVRVIRTFRPLVIYSRFSGTAADGHGHHQMAGYLTPIAFKAAADPAAFPSLAAEGLRPWQPRRLLRNAGRGGGDGAGGATIEIATGVLDPVLGRSYAEIAAEGRSQHKSQAMGSSEPLGPAATTVRSVENLVAASPTSERSVFDGIDTTIPGLASLAGLPAGALQSHLAALDSSASRALADFHPLRPAAIIPSLTEALRATRAARAAVVTVAAAADARAEAEFLLARKEEQLVEALTRAAGVNVDPLADEETIEQGGSATVAVRTFAAEPSLMRVTSAEIVAPAGWTVATDDANRGADGPGRREVPAHSARFRIGSPGDAPISQPYFLASPRRGDQYQWPGAAPKGLPFGPALLAARVTMTIGGEPVTLVRPVTYRLVDAIRGELRRSVASVPAIAVGVESSLMIVPTGDARRHSQRLVVRARNLSSRPVAGTLALRLPPGWSATPASAPLALRVRDEQASVAFIVTAPSDAAAGRYDVVAEARTERGTFSLDQQTIEYPHIQTHRLYTPAATVARVLDLRVAPVRVGYIMGSGDQVPDALRRMGVDVTLLDDEALAAGDFARFDTIVVGIRASEARPAFIANHARLRQFMERGGAVIVQYQQGEYTAASLPPYPAQIAGNSRVTDESAPVRILAATHPVFTFPNRITAADFSDWVQERNLYAFTTFDARYVPLLESADAGESPQRGGEVYARVGKGHYVYTSYAWFRQLPAGVPGAYRQFANLISLPRAPR